MTKTHQKEAAASITEMIFITGHTKRAIDKVHEPQTELIARNNTAPSEVLSSTRD